MTNKMVKGLLFSTVVALLSMVSVAQAEPTAGTTKVEPKTGMEFVWVPSGCFQMGRREGDTGESLVHKVCFKKGFWMGKYEVTQAQYKRLLDINPSFFRGDLNRPVDGVSWDDANDAAEELSYITGDRYRLPSEAEWEYACKAGRDSKYCGSGGKPSRGAWYKDNSDKQTHAIGGKRANSWGLYDMSGNVSEWVQDCGNDSYSDAPVDGSAWRPDDCHERVVRGGSWFLGKNHMLSAYRYWANQGTHSIERGFRLTQN